MKIRSRIIVVGSGLIDRMIAMINMCVLCMYLNMLFDMVGLKGAGVLTCMINLKVRDIWSLPYV